VFSPGQALPLLGGETPGEGVGLGVVSAADERDADDSDLQHQLEGALADISNKCWTLVVWVVNFVSKPSHRFL
jgi:hypothetical protein